MRTKRAISINNSLVHGICNYNCITCGINKSTYQGPKAFQSETVTRAIVDRTLEAAREGLYVRYIANSGDGEPTLHPDFPQRLDLFGDLKARWPAGSVPPPQIAVITNGLVLNNRQEVFEALVRNKILLKISFPTSVPEHYGKIMMMQPEQGKELIDNVIPGIEKAMALAANHGLPGLEFHISPPYYEHIEPDFPKTLELLLNLAKKQKMEDLRLVLFPALSNRTGLVRSETAKLNTFRDFFKRYHGQYICGIKVSMNLSVKTFYPRWTDYVDLIDAFDYPCFWYGNLFLTPFGDSCCCNDQNLQEKDGNIVTHSIRELMELKEGKRPSPICKSCNQTPGKLKGLSWLGIYLWLSQLWKRMIRRI